MCTASVCGKNVKFGLIHSTELRSAYLSIFFLLQPLKPTPVDGRIKSETIEIQIFCYILRTDKNERKSEISVKKYKYRK